MGVSGGSVSPHQGLTRSSGGPYDDRVDIWFWVVVVVGAAVIALVLVGARRSRSRVDPTQVTIDAALAGRIKQLTAKGDKLAAVKELRSATGLGLADAIRIVEKMAPAKGAASGAPNLGKADPQSDADRAAAGIGPDHLDELRALVGAGQQVQAIKRVRELTGWGLKESKTFVDRL